MRMGKLAWLLLAAAPFLGGCGDFWQPPPCTSCSSTSGFTLSSSPTSISVAPNSTSSEVTITVTPGSSFTGTVTLSCPVTSGPTGATSSEYPTCTFSSSSLTFSTTTAQQPTLTVSAASDTPLGAYTMTVTGTSGSTTETTSVCVDVSTTSGTCSVAPTSSGIFYVLNSDQIAGFTISSSALQRVGSSQTLIGATAVAMAPSGAFLYVASTGGGITLYTISSSGALDTGALFNSDGAAAALAVDPSGKWLLVADVTGTLTAYPITTSGILDTTRNVPPSIQLSIGANGVQPGEMAISPNGAVGAVALGSAGTQTFTFNASLAAPIQTLYKSFPPKGSTAISVAFDPQSRFLYIGEVAVFASPSTNTGGLRVFTISGNTLTELSSVSPYHSGGLTPNAILPLASGSYVYVANGMGSGVAGNVTGFAVASSGLTLGSTTAAGVQPSSLAEDSTHEWVFEVGSSGSPYFDAYTFDSSTPGQLDSQVPSTTAATSIAIVAAP